MDASTLSIMCSNFQNSYFDMHEILSCTGHVKQHEIKIWFLRYNVSLAKSLIVDLKDFIHFDPKHLQNIELSNGL